MWVVNELKSAAALLVCAAGLSLVGCGDDPQGSAGGSGAGATGGSAGSDHVTGTGGVGGQEVGTVTVFMVVSSASADTPALPVGPPIEGVRVCELDTDNCVLSDELGRVMLDLPANRETGYSLEKEGYGSRIIPNVTDENFPVNTGWELFTDEQLQRIALLIGTPYPWQGGVPGINVSHGGLASNSTPGVKLTLMDGTGKPFYLEDHGKWLYSSSLEETQPGFFAGFLPLALAGFAEVTPGVGEFELSGGANCRVAQGWPGSTPNRIRIPIREGFNTYGSVFCEVP